MSVSRRQVIQWSGLTALAGLTASALPGCAGEPGPLDELDRIVTAYRELQIGVDRSSPARDRALAALDAVAGRYADGLAEPGNGDGTDARPLWPDLPKGPGSQYFPMMYYRLRTITVAWATPGSATGKRPELPGRLLAALDWLYRNQYNEGTTEQGNWYVYEIGVPYWLLQTIVALDDRLPAADRARYLRPVLRFVADPNRRTVKPETVETGANRADKALITVISGALAGDPARVAAGVAAVTDTAGKGADSLVAKVTKGDGFRTDGSFIQHDSVPYPGHYGLVLLTAVAGLVHVTGGTRYQLEPEARQRFRDSVDESFAPFLFAGSMHESVRGRMLSRQGETGADAGKQLIAAVALLARTAPEPARDRLAASVAGWLGGRGVLPEREPLDLSRYAGGPQPVGVPEVEYVEALAEDESASPDSAERHLVFPQMDRMVHRAGVPGRPRLASARPGPAGTRRSTGRTSAAGTPATGCSTSACRNTRTTTPTPTGPPWTPRRCPAPPARTRRPRRCSASRCPRAARTTPAASGSTTGTAATAWTMWPRTARCGPRRPGSSPPARCSASAATSPTAPEPRCAR